MYIQIRVYKDIKVYSLPDRPGPFPDRPTDPTDRTVPTSKLAHESPDRPGPSRPGRTAARAADKDIRVLDRTRWSGGAAGEREQKNACLVAEGWRQAEIACIGLFVGLALSCCCCLSASSLNQCRKHLLALVSAAREAQRCSCACARQGFRVVMVGVMGKVVRRPAGAA